MISNFIKLTKFFIFLFFLIITNPMIFFKKHRKKSLNLILCKLGPAFIKFGQLLSTRPDIIGDQLTSDLQDLQDRVKPFSSSHIDKIFLKNYKKLPLEIFQEFDYKSLGAGSIAQIHKGTKNNVAYAIKIVRPNIEAQIEKNIELLQIITNFFHSKKKYKRYRLPDVVEFLKSNLMHETDMTIEGASASQLRANLSGDPEVYIPEINWELTRIDILVREWVDVISIKDIHNTNINKKIALTNLVNTFCNQAYRDGVFHADMHPGNIFVDANGRIILIDFGIVGRMNNKTKFYITEILRGFLSRDYKLIAKMHFEAGYVDNKYNIDDFENSCRAIGEQIAGENLKNLSIGNLFTSLLKLTSDFNMHTRIELLLIQKATILIEGVTKIVEPNCNIWQLSDDWLKSHYMKKTAIFQRKAKKILEIFFDKIAFGIGYIENRKERIFYANNRNTLPYTPDNQKKQYNVIDYGLIAIIIAMIFFHNH